MGELYNIGFIWILINLKTLALDSLSWGVSLLTVSMDTAP